MCTSNTAKSAVWASIHAQAWLYSLCALDFGLQEWLDSLVLGIEVAHVHDEVTYDKHVWQWGNLARDSRVAVHLKGNRYS